MDNLNSLRKLTEDIVKRQNDSLESISRLCQKTDTISSDISNLINGLQMVGNRQFAEDRVLDDDDYARGHQQNSSMMTSTTTASLQGVVTRELKLSSILLRAIKLVPIEAQNDTELPPQSSLEPSVPLTTITAKVGTPVSKVATATLTSQMISVSGAQAQTPPAPAPPLPPPPPPPPPQLPAMPLQLPPLPSRLPPLPLQKPTPQHRIESGQLEVPEATKTSPIPPERVPFTPQKPTYESNVTPIPQTEAESPPAVVVEQSVKTKPIDRDRITDILKRYSLYDDDDEDDGSE